MVGFSPSWVTRTEQLDSESASACVVACSASGAGAFAVVEIGHGPLPEGSELELRSGPLEEEVRALAAEGVQSLLLEGGPTLATAFLDAGFVDKLLFFIAPVLAGGGPRVLGDLDTPLELLHLRAEPSGEDVLVEGYLHEP